MSSVQVIQDVNTRFKERVHSRLQQVLGEPSDTVTPFDADAALASADEDARAVTEAIAGGKTWDELANVLKNHEVVRSVTNAEATRTAVLDRRGKFLAGINHAHALETDGGLIDIAVRSRT